jgi:hypothetical protein
MLVVKGDRGGLAVGEESALVLGLAVDEAWD